MKYFILILCIGFVHCGSTSKLEKPDEIISFLTLESGMQDTVFLDEIFFSHKYNPDFKNNPVISVEYIQGTNQIVLNPADNFSGLTFLECSNFDEAMVIPIKIKKKSKVIFQYKPESPVKEMYIMGNFNNWNRRGDRMLDEDGDGTYEAAVSLDDGIYEYQFVLDSREIYDPLNPEKVDNGFGYFNSLKRVVSKDRINAPNLYWIPGKDANIVKFAIDAIASASDIKIHFLLDNELLSSDILKKSDYTAKIDLNNLPVTNKIQRFRLVASYNNEPGNVISLWIKNGKILPPDENALWQDAIIYSLMIDRFKNGNPDNDNPVDHPELTDQANFNGGDFSGISQTIKEGYFDSLGINTIWISPVNKTTNKAFKEWPEPHRYFSGYHGYWPVSSEETEPRFGSMRELKDLVSLAHEHDIKILMDYISNHVHEEHPYFQNHREWFGKVDLDNGEKNIRRWDEYRLTTWFDTFIPSFDFVSSEEAMEAMTDNAIWWLNETKVDGFRHDATKHVPFSFWKTLTNKVKHRVNQKRNLNIYQVGETFGGNDLIKSYVNNGMLDAQFNFNQFFVARRVFVEEQGGFEDLAMAIEKSFEVYGYNHLMGNIMDSHDQVRMMALLEGDLSLSDNGTERAWHEPMIQVNELETYQKEIVFLTYLLTVPGIPIIYYGDEYGITGANDPDNRRMMRFDYQLSEKESKQLDRISNLIQLRDSYSSLRRGDYKTLLFERDILAYTRGDSKERLIVVLNKGSKITDIQINLPEWIQSNQIKSLKSGEVITIDQNKIKLKINDYTADVFMVL